MKSDSPSGPSRLAVGICALLLLLVLFILFWRAMLPDYTVFSNDGPLGAMVAAQNRLPAILTGMWMDLNWLGNPYPAPAPMLSTGLRLITTPLAYSKIFCPFSLFAVGFCAWICFRQYKFSPIACLLVAVAATLNTDFVNTAAWGVCSQPIAFGMNFLALGALADTNSPRRWLRVVLAGCAVGLGVSEAYDIGALFSLFVAAYVVVQSFVGEGPVARRIVQGFGRLALVGVCAGLIAAAALAGLLGTQIKGVAGVEQDAETKAARWSFATQYSIPKIETLGMIVPGLFGFRFDTPGGGAYWGRAGSDPSWDEFVESGGQRGSPGGPFRAGAGSNYTGLLVVLLAAFGVAQSFRKQGSPFSVFERRLIWFWTAAGIAGMLLMWGRFAPFYQLFYSLPYASTIRNPAKFHHILQWALLILFAYGAEALCRQGLQSPAKVTAGLSAHWKSWWARVRGFDRKWIVATGLSVGVVALAWLLYASSRSQLEKHLVEFNRLQYLAQGAKPDQAAAAAANTADDAQATARNSVSQVGRTLLFLIPTVAVVAVVLSGYFTGRRRNIAGGILCVLLIADLLPVNTYWTRFPNWKEKYETNPVIEFLRDKPYEHRVAILPFNSRQAGQVYDFFSQLYGIEWTQHLFLYYNIQSLDIIQEPRVPADKAAYQAALASSYVRRWELGNTRYLFGPAGALPVLNQQLDPQKNRFQIKLQFDPVPKPGTPGHSSEEYSASINPSGQVALFEFAGALPRASLLANWRVSTNESATVKAWLKGIQENPILPMDWRQSLASQSPVDLATLNELSDASFDPHQTVLLAEPLAVAPTGTNQNAGEVKIESYAPKRVNLTAKATAPCVLLLTDKYDPNWHVTVDGQPAKLLRCNFIQRGVFLEKAGEHRVEFHFQPPLTGLYVSLAAIVVGLGFLGYLLIASRKQATVPGAGTV